MASNNIANSEQPHVVADLGQRHLGMRMSVLGAPPATLHAVEHSNHGYTTITLGSHQLSLHSGVPVEVHRDQEVTGQ